MSLNIECILAKFDALVCLLSTFIEKDFSPSAICIQETWLADDFNTDLISIPGYNIIHQGRYCGKKGGLIIYLKDTFSYEIRHILKPYKQWEHLFIDVYNESLHNKITIGNIYRPPRFNNNNTAIQDFITEFRPIIETLSKEKNNCFLAGDFNINLLEVNQRNKYEEYLNLLITNGFLPRIV